MELIKKIKQAETEAQEMIDQARVRAGEEAEKGRKKRLQAQADAEQERKKAVEASVGAAEAQGRIEVEDLKAQAESARQQLREHVAGKTAEAAAKVVNYLRA